MGYFQVRYDSRVVHYDRRGFIRLATEDTRKAHAATINSAILTSKLLASNI